ncbi:MAG: TadE/TadG family type IV pilus assembly protein [Anaerolineales bacterium]|jgi:Flp pilus assembly protein TadG
MKTKLSSRKQKGQSLVELSVLLTFLIVMLAGVADFGRAYFIFLEMRDAAQEGASYGSYSPSEFAEIEARVRDTMKDPVDLSDPTDVTVVPSLTNPSQACSGFDPITLEPNEVEVTILYQMPIAMPFLGTIVGSQELPLVATVTNTILQPPCS